MFQFGINSIPLQNSRQQGRPQKFFQGGQRQLLLIFFRVLAMQREWTYTNEKVPTVTATVAYSVVPVRNLCTEQSF